jgi:hypothetical protein
MWIYANIYIPYAWGYTPKNTHLRIVFEKTRPIGTPKKSKEIIVGLNMHKREKR